MNSWIPIGLTLIAIGASNFGCLGAPEFKSELLSQSESRDSSASPGELASEEVPSGSRSLLVAVGKMGRTTVSCDDGRNWILNQSSDDNIRCWSTGGPDCDHHSGSGMGVAFTRGTFVATFGWGYAGPVMTTSDGYHWLSIPRSNTSTGPAAGLGKLIAFTFQPLISDDLGQTWDTNSGTYIRPNPRRVEFIPYGSGVFIVFASSGSTIEAWRSIDQGETWQQTNYGSPCTGYFGGLAYGNGVAIMGAGSSSGNGICRSTDGGQTWSPINVVGGSNTDSMLGSLVYSNGEFITFSRSYGYSSGDGGATWNRFSLRTLHPNGAPGIDGNVILSNVIEASNGDLVAVSQEWGKFYEYQRFVRSTDHGRTWQDADSFSRSHPITDIARGWVDTSPPGCD